MRTLILLGEFVLIAAVATVLWVSVVVLFSMGGA